LLAPDLEPLGAQEVLEHHPRLYVACSFQKKASVIVDMLVRIEPQARFFVLDTGVLFDGLWARDPDACCGMRKVEPLQRALGTVDAWITGLRRDQTAARANTPKLGWDTTHGKWKAAPLAGWTDTEVWRYITEHDVPYHPLHDRGFASIGCTHCTVPGAGRAGRWAGTDRIECGLHLPSR
jgi:phosphoadenosine phosphosulfate reductase